MVLSNYLVTFLSEFIAIIRHKIPQSSEPATSFNPKNVFVSKDLDTS